MSIQAQQIEACIVYDKTLFSDGGWHIKFYRGILAGIYTTVECVVKKDDIRDTHSLLIYYQVMADPRSCAHLHREYMDNRLTSYLKRGIITNDHKPRRRDKPRLSESQTVS